MTKDEIIREIQRTARDNGGKPLGRAKFLSVTGIRETDWSGRFWARWNEALMEAGFEPNALQQAYEDSVLLQRYAELVRELGRVPVNAELQLKTRRDDSFPSSKTFSRLGPKAKLVERVLAYARATEGYSDIVPILSATIRHHTSQDEPSGGNVSLGYVYLIQHGSRREYKIGRTNNRLRREGEIGIELPEKIEPIHVIETDDPAGIESCWHRRFADKRMKGEWFALAPDDIRAFKRWRRIT